MCLVITVIEGIQTSTYMVISIVSGIIAAGHVIRADSHIMLIIASTQ